MLALIWGIKRLMVLASLCVLLAACGDESAPAPSATPAPQTASVSTTLPDGGELTLDYPAAWTAEEIQPGQIEIATSRDALFFFTDPAMTLNPGEVAGQVSAFTDAEVAANAGMGADAAPADALVAIVAAFGFSADDENPQAYNAEGTPAATLTTTIMVGEIERSLYFTLVDFDGVRVFMFFAADDTVMQYEADIQAIADSMTFVAGE